MKKKKLKNPILQTKIDPLVELLKTKTGLWVLLKLNFPFVIMLLGLCWIVYFNSLHGGFIVDDIPGFKEYDAVRNIGEAFKTYNFQAVIYAIIFKLFGLTTTPAHAISIMMHSVNAILVFLFVYIIFGKKSAIITSLLFLLHPVNVESVTWMSGRPYELNGLIFVATSMLYVAYLKTNKKNYLYASYIVCAGLTLILPSAWVLLTPGLLLILDTYIINRQTLPSKKQIIQLFPYFIISVLLLLILLSRNAISYRTSTLNDVVSQEDLIKSGNYIYNSAFTIATTAKILTIPINLTLYHDMNNTNIQELNRMVVISVGIFILALFLFIKNRKYFGFVAIIYASIFPTFIPWVGANHIAERYLYLGTLFFTMALAQFLLRIEHKYNIKHMLSITVLCISIIYSVIVINRNKDWSDGVTFFSAEVKNQPWNPRLYNELGYVYISEYSNYEKGIKALNTAIQLDPTFYLAYHNLGKSYVDIKDYDNGEKYLKGALTHKDDFYRSWYGLAYIEMQRKNYEMAKQYLYKTLEAKPDYDKATYMLNTILNEEKAQPIK